ncbi:acyl-CoA synthetase [Gordonia sp. NPDC003376]
MTTATDIVWPTYDSYTDLPAIEEIPLSARGLPNSTYELLARAAALWPDRVAVSHLPDADQWTEPRSRTFGELLGDVHAIAHLLASFGVGRRDAVTLLSPNTAQLQVCLLAAEAVGIAAPINPAMHAAHAQALITASGSSVIIASGPDLDSAAWELARELAATTPTVTALLALTPTAPHPDRTPLEPVGGIVVGHLDDFLQAGTRDRLPGPGPVATDHASYFHTGGTTGAPKLAVHTHGNEVANAWMIAANTDLDADANIFAALPLFHVNALIVTTLAPLYKGQHVVWAGPLGFRDVPLYGVFWKLIERYRIATLSGVPTVYSVLAQIPVDADISSLRFAIVGASALPAAVRTAFESSTGVPLCEGYGLTEATCGSARNFPGYIRDRSVGQRFPYQDLKIVDPATGVDLSGPDAVGELCIAGPTVFPGYLSTGSDGGRGVDTEKLVQGWLRTGDLARIDDDGFVYLVGRAKDLIIRGGHNIDPGGIEDAALEHPAINGANAVGRPDEHAGEVPVLFVTLTEHVTESALLEWLRERVPEKAALPKAVHVVDALPVTDVGKPYKPALRRDATEHVVVERLREAGLSGVARTVVADVADGAITVTVAAAADIRPAVHEVLDRLPLHWGFA